MKNNIFLLLLVINLYANDKIKDIEIYNTNTQNILPSIEFLYPTNLMLTLGYSTPTNVYDSYSNEGTAFKLLIEQPMKKKSQFKYSLGWQNISFSENIISYDSWNGLIIREGEKANLFDLGIKFIPFNGFGKNKLFKPYISASAGIGFFKQYTEYDYPDTYEDECDNFWNILFNIIFDEDCDVEKNYNINTEIDSRMVSPFMTIDLGTSIKINKSSNYNLEFGIRYNMIENIQASEWEKWQEIEDQNSFNKILEKKINADYKTIFLGFSYSLKTN